MLYWLKASNLVLVFTCSLLVFRNTVYFCVLILCINWIFVPLKFKCWNLPPSVLIFGDGAFMNSDSVLIRETPERSLTPPSMWRAQWKDNCEQEADSHQTPNMVTPYLGVSSVQNCERKMFVVYKPPSMWDFVYSRLNGWKQFWILWSC